MVTSLTEGVDTVVDAGVGVFKPDPPIEAAFDAFAETISSDSGQVHGKATKWRSSMENQTLSPSVHSFDETIWRNFHH